MSAIEKCIQFPFDPDEWGESIFAERFLHPLLTPEEAATFRAYGRALFYAFLESDRSLDHGESRISAELRGAVRDLQLISRFLRALGDSHDAEDLQRSDVAPVILSAKIAPEIEELALQLEAVLLPERGR